MGCGLPSLALDREDGLRPTVPSTRDLSVLRAKVERVLQELYIALTCARTYATETLLLEGEPYAAGLVFLLGEPAVGASSPGRMRERRVRRSVLVDPVR